MTVEFNHTIVWAHDSKASASFLSQMLGLPAPNQWGPFQVVATGNGVSVDFMDKDGAKIVSHGRYVAFQMAEVAIPRNLFADILRLIEELRPPPDAAAA